MSTQDTSGEFPKTWREAFGDPYGVGKKTKPYEKTGLPIRVGVTGVTLDEGVIDFGEYRKQAEAKLSDIFSTLRTATSYIDSLGGASSLVQQLESFEGKPGADNLIRDSADSSRDKKRGDVTTRKILNEIVGAYSRDRKDEPDQRVRIALAKSLNGFGLKTTIEFVRQTFGLEGIFPEMERGGDFMTKLRVDLEATEGGGKEKAQQFLQSVAETIGGSRRLDESGEIVNLGPEDQNFQRLVELSSKLDIGKQETISPDEEKIIDEAYRLMRPYEAYSFAKEELGSFPEDRDLRRKVDIYLADKEKLAGSLDRFERLNNLRGLIRSY